MARKILVIDDNQIERAMLETMLSPTYDILTAADGKEAISMLFLRGNSISAILLDIVMPNMDGYEVLNKIRQNPIWSQIPVIICSILSDVEMQEKALHLGAYGILSKPYNASLIRSTLQNSIRLREMSAIVNSLRRDKLTGLLNRQTFLTEAEELIKIHPPGYYVLSCFDIENFKIINDQYGVQKGDKVLQHVATAIRGCAESIDGLSCRFMADKFAMLFPASYINSEIINISHIEAATPDCIDHMIKIRIGRYIVNDFSVSVSSMYDRATLAQESIKDRYDLYIKEYDESMRKSLLNEQEIVTVMYEALNDGQFLPWFQPQYNHMTGAIIGAEALVRWKKTDNDAFVPPDFFIPIFERNGFVYELDKCIWEQSAAIIRKWIDEGRQPLPISVNISRHDIFHDDFFRFITGLILKYAIPKDLLRLEITESAFTTAQEQIVSIIKKLVEFGFTVEIDDFGSGYSSLNTLKDVPAHVLKIDMKFMSDKGDSQRGGTILESIVRMAKWLQMSVIAEGVENKNQADYLKSIGCHYIQGFYYAKPMPLNEYEALLDIVIGETTLTKLETVKTFDNSSFWNPQSIDTLIFNNYVGSACIFEFHNDHSEILRVNDRFRQEFYGLYTQEIPITDLSPEKLLDAENLKILYSNTRRAIETQEELTCEVQTTAINDNTDNVLYFRCTCSIIAKTEDRYLCYTVLTNITKMRRAEAEANQKERETTEKLQAILDNIDNGISAVMLKPEGSKLLFANSKYYELSGYTENSVYTADDDFLAIHPADRKKIQQQIRKIAKSKNSTTLEFRVVHHNSSIVWLKADISVTNFLGISVPIQLTVLSDITAKKEADEQIVFLNRMAGKLLAQQNVDKGITEVLSEMCKYFAGLRTFIFEFDYDTQTSSNTYEVCAKGIASHKHQLQKIPLSFAKMWIYAFEQQNYIFINDVAALDNSRIDEKNILISQGIQSVIAAALRRDGKLIGCIGIDDPTQKKSQVAQIAALGDYISVMLTRRDLHAALQNEASRSKTLLDNIPCGTAIYEYTDKMLLVIHLNKYYREKLGIMSQNIAKIPALDAVHKDDRNVVLTEIESAIQEKRDASCTIRIQCSENDYRTFLVVARIVPKTKNQYMIYASHLQVTNTM